MKVKILQSATEDLARGFRFYEQQGEGLGSYFLDALFSDIDSLLVSAGIHNKIFGKHRLLSRRFPFAVYYAVGDDTVTVWAVLDCRQDPRKTSRRLK